MKAKIYVNYHVMTANKKATKETGELVDNVAISVNAYWGSVYAKRMSLLLVALLFKMLKQPDALVQRFGWKRRLKV